MSHFYGTLEGSRGEATRCGTKDSGMQAIAAGWGGAIRVDVYRQDGVDQYRVTLEPWRGSGGDYRTLAEGVLNSAAVYVAAAR